MNIKELSRIVWICLLTGLALPIFFYVLDLFSDVSHMSAYKQIKLGMTGQQVFQILKQDEIGCLDDGLTAKVDPGRCAFTDFWRTYEIRFDSDGTVSRKFLNFRIGRRPLFERVRKLIYPP